MYGQLDISFPIADRCSSGVFEKIEPHVVDGAQTIDDWGDPVWDLHVHVSMNFIIQTIVVEVGLTTPPSIARGQGVSLLNLTVTFMTLPEGPAAVLHAGYIQLRPLFTDDAA